MKFLECKETDDVEHSRLAQGWGEGGQKSAQFAARAICSEENALFIYWDRRPDSQGPNAVSHPRRGAGIAPFADGASHFNGCVSGIGERVLPVRWFSTAGVLLLV
jgi:hypothetical protein